MAAAQPSVSFALGDTTNIPVVRFLGYILCVNYIHNRCSLDVCDRACGALNVFLKFKSSSTFPTPLPLPVSCFDLFKY